MRPPAKVKVTAKEIGRSVLVMIGDTMLPITKATIRIEMNEFVKIELETYAHGIDIEALQRDTELVIKGDPS